MANKIGPRSSAHHMKLTRAADAITTSMCAAGYEVNLHPYSIFDANYTNIEVQITGTHTPQEIVIIGAHYDSVGGSPGANDNASGVAALLALARSFAPSQPHRTLRFVAFVNEEPPYFQTDHMGSLVYARRCKAQNENVAAMLSFDGLGYYSDQPNSQAYPFPFNLLYPTRANFIGFVGNLSSRTLVRKVIGSFRRHTQFPSEGAAMPAVVPEVGWSDHWSFWQHGYPALMVTDTLPFRYPHYHSAQDTIDKIDFDRMARVVDGLEMVIADLTGTGGSGQ